jgi:hypothetical protein
MTNKKFSETNAEFIEACRAANLKPTARQAGKWRDSRGLANRYRKVNRRHQPEETSCK